MFNAITSKLLENLKLIVDDNDPIINKLAEFKIDNNMFPKNCVIAISDTHGDIAAIIGCIPPVCWKNRFPRNTTPFTAITKIRTEILL